MRDYPLNHEYDSKNNKPEFEFLKPESWNDKVRLVALILFPLTFVLYILGFFLFGALALIVILSLPFLYLGTYLYYILYKADRKGFEEFWDD